MQVIFGLDLDACPMPACFRGLGRMVCGPRGLMDLLELRLGLPPANPDRSVRLLDYRRALEQGLLNGKNRFYANSFEVDPFGTARILLNCRDDLCLAGWAPDVPIPGVSRLADLAAVEALFASQDGPAERLGRIAAQIRLRAKLGDVQISLLDEEALFPKLWRDILQILKGAGSLRDLESEFPLFRKTLPAEPLAPPGTLLYRVQNALLGRSCEGVEASRADSTFCVVEGQVLSRNAAAAAQWIMALPHGNSARLVASPRELAPLNLAMREVDGPSFGSGSGSSAAAVIQLVPILLRLHWAPFDPRAWLEFFLHPVSPLSPALARPLASQLNSLPSRENSAWSEKIRSLLDGETDAAARKRLEEQLKSWLNPQEFSGEAPVSVFIATLRKLGQWMGARSAAPIALEASGLFARAARSVSNLAAMLEAVKESSLRREALERILAEWLPSAEVVENLPADLGGPGLLKDAAYLLEEVDHVVWWQPRSPAVSAQPWSQREREALRLGGLVFPCRDRLLQRTGEQYRRAVLLARRSAAVFVCRGSETLSDLPPPPFLVRLKKAAGPGALLRSGDLIPKVSVPVRPLPIVQSEWKFPGVAFPPRKNESFTSLSKYLYTPWDWVLTYRAKLCAGPLQEFRIADDVRRQGSLLHGFVESLLEPEPDPLDLAKGGPGAGSDTEMRSPAASLLETLVRRLFSEKSSSPDWSAISRQVLDRWVESQWEELLAQFAAHYLVRGQEAVRSELLYVAKNGLYELIEQFRKARVVSVRCEESISGRVPFEAGFLDGIVDLRVASEQGLGVIDLKLGGKSARSDELSKNRHLQLAIYGHLISELYEREPFAAYFIFSGGGSLLARSNCFFPGAQVVTSRQAAKGEDWQICWRDFLRLWKTRRAQIEQGIVRVTLKRCDDLLPKDWQIPEPGKYSQCQALIGWSEID